MEDEELWVSRLMCLCPTPLSVDAPSSRYAPSPESTEGGASLIDPLMNGVVFLRGTGYDISALDRVVLADLGFTLHRIFMADFESL